MTGCKSTLSRKARGRAKANTQTRKEIARPGRPTRALQTSTCARTVAGLYIGRKTAGDQVEERTTNPPATATRRKARATRKAKGKANTWTLWKRISLLKQLQPCRVLHKHRVQLEHSRAIQSWNRGSWCVTINSVSTRRLVQSICFLTVVDSFTPVQSRIQDKRYSCLILESTLQVELDANIQTSRRTDTSSAFARACSSETNSVSWPSLIKILVALCANFGTGSSDSGLSSIAVCSLHKLLRKQRSRSSGRVLCGNQFGVELWAVVTIREERRSGITAGAVFVCVWCGQNDRSGIRRGSQVLSPASDFEDSFDKSHVLHFHVHPEMLLVPSATGLVWLEGRNQPILTTMMLAGHRPERVYGSGAQMCIFSPEVIVWAGFRGS